MTCGHAGPCHIGTDDDGHTRLRVTDATNHVHAQASLTDNECAEVALRLVASLIVALPDAPQLGGLLDAYNVLDGLSKVAVP